MWVSYKHSGRSARLHSSHFILQSGGASLIDARSVIIWRWVSCEGMDVLMGMRDIL